MRGISKRWKLKNVYEYFGYSKSGNNWIRSWFKTDWRKKKEEEEKNTNRLYDWPRDKKKRRGMKNENRRTKRKVAKRVERELDRAWSIKGWKVWKIKAPRERWIRGISKYGIKKGKLKNTYRAILGYLGRIGFKIGQRLAVFIRSIFTPQIGTIVSPWVSRWS